MGPSAAGLDIVVFCRFFRLRAAAESTAEKLLHGVSVLCGQRYDFRAGVHQRQGQPSAQQGSATVNRQGHNIGQGYGPVSQPEIKSTPADAFSHLLDRDSQESGGLQDGENELKDIHGIFEPDDDNGQAKTSSYEADNFFDGFHCWHGVLSFR